MRIALLTGTAALALMSTAAARAEVVYVADLDGPGYAYSAAPGYVVEERSYVVAPPRRERVVVVPRREVVVEPPVREVVVDRPAVMVDRPAYVAPYDGYGYRRGDYYSTTYRAGSCVVDGNGFERCY